MKGRDKYYQNPVGFAATSTWALRYVTFLQKLACVQKENCRITCNDPAAPTKNSFEELLLPFNANIGDVSIIAKFRVCN